MAQFDPSILNGQKTLLDRQMLQQAFEQQKAMQALQMAETLKSLNQDPNALSLKDRLEFAFKERELAQKAGADSITTNPGMGGGYVPMNLDALTQSVMQAESGGNPNAVSPAGAQGLMQIMPDTARDPGYGVQPLQGWDGQNPMTAPPEEQIRFGKDYLDAMLRQNGGNQELALASYNAGPGAVQKYGGVPPFKETQDYVQKITNSMSPQGAKPLYQGGKPFTQGLNAGYQWATDADGNRIAQKIPGTPPNKEEMDFKKQASAKEKFDTTLLEIQDLYDQLAKEGQIRTETQGPVNNTLNYLANSNILGQKAIGAATGTKSSTIREKIDAARSRAAALYIDAAGLSSGQTNSVAEQQRFLEALGGYDKNYEANQQILEGLSQSYGTGKVKQKSLSKNNAVDYKEYFK